jgi:hypothetical protein
MIAARKNSVKTRLPTAITMKRSAWRRDPFRLAWASLGAWGQGVINRALRAGVGADPSRRVHLLLGLLQPLRSCARPRLIRIDARGACYLKGRGRRFNSSWVRSSPSSIDIRLHRRKSF